ncbi:MAG: CYTH domain-containing protein [Desulfobacula sp.]|nr:CYTH domain-containing protein [Desulfobacula sp.]
MAAWEYKFVFKNDQMAGDLFLILTRLKNFAGYQCYLEKTEKYSDLYYDTADLNLEAQGVVCRKRKNENNPDSYLTLKRQSIGPNKEVIYLKTEPVRVEPDRDNKTTTQGLAEEILSTLRIFTGTGSIDHILTLEVERTTVNIMSSVKVIAYLHLDLVKGYLPGQNTPAVKEYEIELKSDNLEFPEADLFCDYLKRSFNMISIARSKLRRMAGLAKKGIAGKPKRVILDMDTGVDDALAIILAMKSPEIQVMGLTTTGGNVDADQSAKNTVLVLNTVRDWVKERYPDLPPVARGEPLADGAIDASDVHGPDGLGGINETDSNKGFHDDAAILFRDIVYGHASHTITLITTGPLTNVAHWIDVFPDAVCRLKEIICMGGVFFQEGNRSQTSEFNIHANPTSARKVVEFCRTPQSSGIRSWHEKLPLTFIGLDVTHQVRFRRKVLQKRLRDRPDDTQLKFIRDISKLYMDFYFRNEGLDGCYLHDPLAVGYAIDPTLCQADQFIVEVEDKGEFTSGMTIADYRPTRLFKDKMKEVTWVCYKVDSARFEELFLDRILNN